MFKRKHEKKRRKQNRRNPSIGMLHKVNSRFVCVSHNSVIFVQNASYHLILHIDIALHFKMMFDKSRVRNYHYKYD